MQFMITGFKQDTTFRVFTFDGVAADRSRTVFTVRTDLALSRSYGIRVQELPLLCRAVLERRDEEAQEREFTFTEQDMRLHASGCAAEKDAAQKKKAMRRPFNPHAETASQIPAAIVATGTL
ncbi:MAG TPA: hypothetical protein VK604_27555 [Bryobacteraceae bacterium]|nr:hypothetical protein [Bryobacteraceae bacterium]